MSTINHTHLRLLAVYVAVVESGSFAAAARQLNSSRSRVSEQVAQLENTLGVRLLQRSTRRLLVTHEGKRVYAEAMAIPVILKKIESAVSPSEPRGRVAITMNSDVAEKFVLPLLGDFQKQYPLVNLDLILDDKTVDLIGEEIDLGIRVGLPRDSSLVGRVLHEERLSLFANPEYLAVHGTPKSVRQLQGHHWLLLPQLSTDGKLRFRLRGKAINVTPASYQLCNSPLLIQKMVVAGLGLGALIPSMVQPEIASGSLVSVMPAVKSDPFIFSLVYPSRQQIPQRTRVVIDYLLSCEIFSAAGQ